MYPYCSAGEAGTGCKESARCSSPDPRLLALLLYSELRPLIHNDEA